MWGVIFMLLSSDVRDWQPVMAFLAKIELLGRCCFQVVCCVLKEEDAKLMTAIDAEISRLS